MKSILNIQIAAIKKSKVVKGHKARKQLPEMKYEYESQPITDKLTSLNKEPIQ